METSKDAVISLAWVHQVPVPLTIFRSNSKFDQNLQCSCLTRTQLITTTFCTRHDSYTVVTCAKFRYDQWSMFQTRALRNLIEFRIQSPLVGRAPGWALQGMHTEGKHQVQMYNFFDNLPLKFHINLTLSFANYPAVYKVVEKVVARLAEVNMTPNFMAGCS